MSDAPQTLTVVIPLSVKKRGGRKVVITPNVLEIERRQDITLIKAVARAFRWRRMLEEGRFATLTELAEAEKINRSYLCRILRLTLLAPDIVEAILDGRQPEGMTLPGLMEPFPVDWEGHRAALLTSETTETGSATTLPDHRLSR
jgi:hypothetical protein